MADAHDTPMHDALRLRPPQRPPPAHLPARRLPARPVQLAPRPTTLTQLSEIACITRRNAQLNSVYVRRVPTRQFYL